MGGTFHGVLFERKMSQTDARFNAQREDGRKEMPTDRHQSLLTRIERDKPVLIAGPTASGKSALALEIAQTQGGIIVNADASQVYDCWRVISARPTAEEEALAPHALYGHISDQTRYSTGHWLREVEALLAGTQRLIIVGGTGLYFQALTQGLAYIPETPVALRQQADKMTLVALIDGLDKPTAGRLDLSNRARVQRAWEVFTSTGRGLADWQAATGTALLPPDACTRIALTAERDWLNDRIERRFDLMLKDGALDEVAAVAPRYDPDLPAHRAIGVPELIQHLRGALTLAEARDATVIATRQFAKRQRTWQRSKMADWISYPLGDA